MRNQLDIDDPQLPRRRKVPRRYEQGLAQAEFPASPKEEYRCIYFEALDLSVTSISSRFDQKGFKIFSNVEQLLFKACKGKEFRDELKCVKFSMVILTKLSWKQSC